ncbi:MULTISPECIES: carbohydrate ABC transporter permease [Microbacterium]|uniref:Sugar ABC transporter permease n=1 Tax=Microbacterium resistens TaxID=156977 RepID=A0ABY3RNK4_9MICO|nr:sugar ABC transporter permease [Microbacterium resistens]MDA4890385.1 sugar ABC transporter permease [Streptomyces sp. MS2A]UGS25513.1 sugar ABC transporter permease [Microbacterium resistens]
MTTLTTAKKPVATDRPAGAVTRVLARREARIALLFVLPAFLLFLAFRFGPTIVGVALSLFEYDISGEIAWKGLENFQRLVADPLFWRALSTTVLYTVFAVPIALVLSTVMALGVRRSFRGSRFFRSVFFLPVITSLVLAGSIFVWIFSANGPWSALMTPLGLGGSWLGSTVLVLPAIVVVGVWSRFGYGMMIMIAAMQDVPRELEEAALMDGANAWQRFRWIILPYLRPTIFFLAVIETTAAFQVFDVIYVMTQGGPANASYSLVYLLYDQGFKYFDYGYAAAVGVALFVMTLVVALIQRLVIGRQK